MTRPTRLAIVPVIVAGVVLLIGLLPKVMASSLARAAPAADDPIRPTTELSATLRLLADRPVVAVGQTMRLTATLSVEGCDYGVIELTVVEDAGDAPLFAHVEPPQDTIGSGVLFPSVWTFRALRPGAAEFAAQTFGEGYCDGAWFWHYENARSAMVQVVDLPYRLWLPLTKG